MQLYARVTGTPSGPDVILLHGLFGAQENLGMIARQLAPDYRVHSLDLRNHGRSPHSALHDYPHLAEDVLEYLNTHHLHSVDLVGHSMGGKVAMQLALAQPQRVRRLVVLDMAPVAYTDRHKQVFAALHAVASGAPHSRREGDRLLAHYLDDAGMRQFLLQNLVPGDCCWHWRFNLTALDHAYPDIIAALPEALPFDGPTLFLKGATSDYLKPEYRETILHLFPHARMRQFAGCGHWLHAEAPERVGRVIRDFLQ